MKCIEKHIDLKKKIILLSHEASFSGAPSSLLNLSMFLKQTNEYKIVFFFTRGGPLIPNFEKIGKVYCLERLGSSNNILIRLLIRLLPLYRIRKVYLKVRFKFFGSKCIVSNTIVNSNLLSYFDLNQVKLITIVREKKGVIQLFDKLKMNNSSLIIKNTFNFIAVSKSVKTDLIKSYNISKEKIKIIYNSIPYFKAVEYDEKTILNWKTENNIPLDHFIVGSCGGPIWRKGPDIFLNIINLIKKKYVKEKIFFLWKGGNENNSWFIEFNHEIELLGIKDCVKIIPESSNVNYFYNAIDIYLSTAREEPFGLTLLEAGLHGIPCLALEKSGGPEEILSNEVGIILPFGDFYVAAKEIISLKKDSRRRSKYSNNIKKYSNNNILNQNFKKYKKLIDSFII